MKSSIGVQDFSSEMQGRCVPQAFSLPGFRGFRELGGYILGKGLDKDMLFRRPLLSIGQIDLLESTQQKA